MSATSETPVAERASARFYAGAEARGTAQAQAVRDQVQLMPSLSYQEVAAIEQRIRAFQEQVGYTGDYDSWIASVTPSITAGQVDLPADIALEATRQSSAAFIAPHAVDELNERECKNDYASKQNSTGDRGVTRHWSRDGSGTC